MKVLTVNCYTVCIVPARVAACHGNIRTNRPTVIHWQLASLSGLIYRYNSAMKFSEDKSAGSHIIRAYDAQSININGLILRNSLVVSKQHLLQDWPVKSVKDLNESTLAALMVIQPEVILIGTGQVLQFPHPECYASLLNQGIGVEFMDSGAACRTYNILLGEERRVIAGIIL